MISIINRILAIAVTAGGLCFAAFATERVAPESPNPWRVSPSVFPQPKQRANVSGFVCAPNAPEFCLAVTDEGHEAAFVRLTDGQLTPGAPFSLPIAADEFDAEGAAADGEFFYIVGSHSVKRKSCEDHLANRTVLRFGAVRRSDCLARSNPETSSGTSLSGCRNSPVTPVRRPVSATIRRKMRNI